MDFRYFLAVAESGSLADASKLLHVAPSAISRQIVLLEESVGSKLFDRRPRGMTLTAAGVILAQHATRSRLEEETVLASIRSNDFPSAHIIQLVSTEGLSRYFLPRVMTEFIKTMPKTQFVMTVTSPIECVSQVANGSVDVGLTFSTAPDSAVNIEYACSSPISALVRQGHPLAAFPQLSLSQLQPYPLALTPQGTTQRQLFDLVCKLNNLKFNEALICNYSGAIHEYVRQSNAVTLGSAISHAGRQQDDLVSINFIDQQLLQREIQLLTMPKRTLPPLVNSFVDFLISRLKS